MLGKRARRPPIKRTTSMNEFTLDLNGQGAAANNYPPSDPNNPFHGAGGGLDQQLLVNSSAASPRLCRSSADFVEASFLRICFLCKRRLTPGQDIYMYRGDSAFCSLECRHHQMVQDETKEKCSLASKKDAVTAGGGSRVSAKGETVAAV